MAALAVTRLDFDAEQNENAEPPLKSRVQLVARERTSQAGLFAQQRGLEAERDRYLVAEAQAGDQAAFAQLYCRYQERAQSLAFGLLRDENDAREIVQEAFLKVYRGLGAFNGDSSFFTWLYRIVRNLCIDLLRRPSRRETDSLETYDLDELSESRALLRRAADPLTSLTQAELARRLEACLAELPQYHRGVIVMRELEGKSYEEMAEEMGVSKGTIMSRLFHARQKLRRSLAAFAEQQWAHSADYSSAVERVAADERSLGPGRGSCAGLVARSLL